MSDEKPNPFGAVLRKTGNRPEAADSKVEPANKDGGGSNSNPFGATLRSSGSKFSVAAAAEPDKKEAGANPFGAVLRPTKPAADAAASDKPNPFGAVLKPTSKPATTARPAVGLKPSTTGGSRADGGTSRCSP